MLSLQVRRSKFSLDALLRCMRQSRSPIAFQLVANKSTSAMISSASERSERKSSRTLNNCSVLTRLRPQYLDTIARRSFTTNELSGRDLFCMQKKSFIKVQFEDKQAVFTFPESPLKDPSTWQWTFGMLLQDVCEFWDLNPRNHYFSDHTSVVLLSSSIVLSDAVQSDQGFTPEGYYSIYLQEKPQRSREVVAQDEAFEEGNDELEDGENDDYENDDYENEETKDELEEEKEDETIKRWEEELPRVYERLLKERASEMPPSDPTNPWNLTDLRKPHLWYSLARGKPRKIVCHLGPTNSGKTHQALERLMTSESGIYCGPLRLLAVEQFEKMNGRNVKCSLKTGQQIKDVPNARHVACTIEMTDLSRPVEVAVIDEIQMISDPSRGWAWTRTLLGLNADEIHVCGSPTAKKLVERLIKFTGDELVINEYDRLSSLNLEKFSLDGEWKKVRPGDALITFSRADIFRVKRLVEKYTQHRCCVVYGNLPPETRAMQAQTFNNEGSGFDVVVATDAIGMGLNLNIRRIVFTTLEKFDGNDTRKLTPSEIQQIAGRAGRYSSLYPDGFVTTLLPEDLDYLKSYKILNRTNENLVQAGLFPTEEQIQAFATLHPDIPFSQLLSAFEVMAQTDGLYFLCNLEDRKQIAKEIDDLPLSLRERYIFTTSPTQADNPSQMKFLRHYAASLASKHKVTLSMKIPNIKITGKETDEQLHQKLTTLETIHLIADLYLWLGNRFPAQFVQRELAERVVTVVSEMMNKALLKNEKKIKKSKSDRKKKMAYIDWDQVTEAFAEELQQYREE